MAPRCGKAQMARKAVCPLPSWSILKVRTERERTERDSLPIVRSFARLRRQDRSLQPDSPLSTGKLSKLGRWTVGQTLLGLATRPGGSHGRDIQGHVVGLLKARPVEVERKASEPSRTFLFSRICRVVVFLYWQQKYFTKRAGTQIKVAKEDFMSKMERRAFI